MYAIKESPLWTNFIDGSVLNSINQWSRDLNPGGKMSTEKLREVVKKSSWLERIISAIIIIFVLAIIIAGLFRLTFVTFVDKHEACFIYDRVSGTVEIPDRTGYIVRTPILYSVHKLDIRPYQISITANIGSPGTSSVSSRVLNAKLVRFNPKGIPTFIAWHGRDAGDKLENLLEIMKCYAFDKEGGKDCPFITVLNEINPSQTPSQLGDDPTSSMTSGTSVGGKQ
jgi:hypothetical protein